MTDLQEAPAVFADVVLPLALPNRFTYRVPESLREQVTTGQRVIVQFGKRKVMTGIIFALHGKPPERYEAKPIVDILDEGAILSSLQQKFYTWLAKYYMCHEGEVLTAGLPSGLKLNSESYISATGTPYDDLELNDKEFRLMERLGTKSISYNEAAILADVKNAYHIIKSLLKKGLIHVREELKEKYKPKTVKKVRISPDIATDLSILENILNQLDKQPKQQEVLLQYISQIPIFENPAKNEAGIPKKQLKEKGVSDSSLKTLVKNGILEEFSIEVPRYVLPDEVFYDPKPLSAHQESALNYMHSILKEKDVCLLHGVTGSGKTEVYIRLIREALDGGSQVLFLLPEIALTTHIVTRLKAVFGHEMGVYHSKFSDNERVEVWQKLHDGSLSFIIGVRSSIFLPFDNLGMIIVDEEHDPSYKQQDPAPRYHARDAAIMLAKLHHAKIVLGSATPSVESFFHANTGRYGLSKLTKRHGNAKMPEIVPVKLRKREKGAEYLFSKALLEAISHCLENKEQIILFQNRRGFSPIIVCETCGYITKCENCDISLTYHRYSNELRCHYCGFHEDVPSKCNVCGSGKLQTLDFGTEKIEDELMVYFPDAVIRRMDLDTTRKKMSFQLLLEEFEERKIDILVGTQMVTKGLDFDHVTLVGVFDADRMLHFPDFRSYERTFQLVTQVGGRAGRKDKPGKVIVQTNDPQQDVITKIANYDYLAFFNKEISERKKYAYPPFSRLIELTIKDPDRGIAAYCGQVLGKELVSKLGNKRVLGPEEPVVSKIRNQYIQQIMIKFERGTVDLFKIRDIIQESIEKILSKKEYAKTRVITNADPY